MANHTGGDVLEHLNLLGSERHDRSHDDRLACMYAKRIEVFHRYHGETVVVGIADNLELNLLPSLERLLDKNLLGVSESAFAMLNKLLVVVADAGSESAERIARTHHHGIADAVSHLDGILYRLHGLRNGSFHFYLIKFLYKQITVLGDHDGLYGSSEHLDTVALKNAAQIEFGSAVKRGLSAKRQKDTVGTFLFDDFFYKIRGDRQEIYLVGHSFRSLYRCDVGVD